MRHARKLFCLLVLLSSAVSFAEGAPIQLLGDRASLSQWQSVRKPQLTGDSLEWEWLEGDVLRNCYTWCGSIQTLEKFSDFFLHLEFKEPDVDHSYHEQLRGNSGVYLQGRYELQVLESFGNAVEGKNDVGAIYGIADPLSNAAKPPLEWQTYEVWFKAARFDPSGVKISNARVTITLNGEVVQLDRELPHSTEGGDPEGPEGGPIRLQDHDPMAQVEYRNIWIRR